MDYWIFLFLLIIESAYSYWLLNPYRSDKSVWMIESAGNHRLCMEFAVYYRLWNLFITSFCNRWIIQSKPILMASKIYLEWSRLSNLLINKDYQIFLFWDGFLNCEFKSFFLFWSIISVYGLTAEFLLFHIPFLMLMKKKGVKEGKAPPEEFDKKNKGKKQT